MNLPTVVVSLVALSCNLASATKLIDYLLSKRVHNDLTMTAGLARKMDRKSLEGLASQAKGGFVLVLPTDAAWRERRALYDKLNSDKAAIGKLRNDLIFAAGGEMGKVGGFDELLKYAEENGGVVDTTYGTSMIIRKDGTVCLADYDDDWNVVPGDCAKLRLPPLLFDDGALYLTDHIILPENLIHDLETS